jgi:hypothetical protein
MMDCCCETFEGMQIWREDATEWDLLFYFPEMRKYGLLVPMSYPQVYEIYYCPWCGAKLPESLESSWRCKVNEYLVSCGLSQISEKTRYEEIPLEKLPDPLRTEQWWQDLGL